MYIKNQHRQFSFSDFDQPTGLKMNPENRWIKKASAIPWDEIEDKYARLFPSGTGNPAKPLRMALGSLLIQKQYGYSDRELVDQITENPYYQYFIGLPGYQQEPPFVPSLLVEFRKRLSEERLNEINEMIIAYNTKDDSGSNGPGSSGGSSGEGGGAESTAENSGILILDATCAPQHIAYPQDISLLNGARENLEKIIDTVCYEYNLSKPRTYRQNARKDYISLAKCRRRSGKRIRKAIKQQLQYIRRDLGYIDQYMAEGRELSEKDLKRLGVIRKVYEQQKYMYENNTHSVADRIVSISQPYIRPIVRGKVKTPTEFGAKFDMSIDADGMARIEKLSFDAYNESETLMTSVENYKERTGHYPKKVLVDTIYRNRNNLNYCKEHCIKISGPALGRPKKNVTADEKKQAYDDAVDRICVERGFSLAKRNFGLGLIVTKLDETTRGSIVLSIIAMNLDRLVGLSLARFLESIFKVLWQAEKLLSAWIYITSPMPE